MKDVILLVEDDPNIMSVNRRILEREGFQVMSANTIQSAREQLYAHVPSVIVLDITLPDGNGIEFCEEIRPLTTAPVLFLTALDEKSDLIDGLRAGGNDYITKPYDIDEFLARIKAQLQLAKMNTQAAQNSRVLKQGPLTLDRIAMRAYLNEQDMMLSSREFSVLLFLLKHKGTTVSAKELYEGAWSQPLGNSQSALWKCISRLKSKLSLAENQISLMNFRNEGYQLDIIDHE